MPDTGSVGFFVAVLPTFLTHIGPISGVTGPNYVGGAETTPEEVRVISASRCQPNSTSTTGTTGKLRIGATTELPHQEVHLGLPVKKSPSYGGGGT